MCAAYHYRNFSNPPSVHRLVQLLDVWWVSKLNLKAHTLHMPATGAATWWMIQLKRRTAVRMSPNAEVADDRKFNAIHSVSDWVSVLQLKILVTEVQGLFRLVRLHILHYSRSICIFTEVELHARTKILE